MCNIFHVLDLFGFWSIALSIINWGIHKEKPTLIVSIWFFLLSNLCISTNHFPFHQIGVPKSTISYTIKVSLVIYIQFLYLCNKKEKKSSKPSFANYKTKSDKQQHNTVISFELYMLTLLLIVKEMGDRHGHSFLTGQEEKSHNFFFF